MNQIIIAALFILTACSSIDNFHREIDREEKRHVVKKEQPRDSRDRGGDRFHAFRDSRFKTEDDKRPINNPMTYSLGGGPGGQAKPAIKRDYRPSRHNAADFRDNGGDGSLWANQGNSSSLFTYQNEKHTGDVIIINVMEDLRNQISAELKRAFPDRPKKIAEGEEAGKKEDKVSTAAAAPAGKEQDNEMDMKVYDKISGTVMEEISKDYILIRGRKEVIFKKEKRSMEVTALVSRKDIMENDYVNSDRMLESRVYILGENE